MPLPFILGGLALGAAALGIGAQANAKETNKKAQEIAEDAQNLYNKAKHSLEVAQKNTEDSLMKLGISKKEILETSIKQFLITYDRIKNIQMSESIGLNEIKNFSIEKQDTIQLREMSDIYESTFLSGASGVATGAVIALAASGSLPIVTGTLSIAGSALAAGEIGIAAGLAGSALSFGAAMTPLAAIAAPALLFTGISASIKADENLEKAKTMYAEAEVAVEKMKTSEVLCNAIIDRSNMYNNLLLDLNKMFSYCTSLLDGVTRKKMGIFKNKTVDAKTFSDDELKLVAITRSLAGAVKAVIDTPILSENGEISTQSTSVYENTTEQLPIFTKIVDEVKATSYRGKAIVFKPSTHKKNKEKGKGKTILGFTRNIFAFLAGLFMFFLFMIDNIAFGLLAFSITTLLIIDNNVKAKFFKIVKILANISLASAFCILFYSNCSSIILQSHYILKAFAFGFISLVALGICLPKKENNIGNFKRIISKISISSFFFNVFILLYAFIFKFLGFSHSIFTILINLIYIFFIFISIFSFENLSSKE